jgi:O-antigen ligase
VKALERYWWPTTILIYPLASVFWLIPALHPLGLDAPRNFLIVIALIGGVLFEWTAHPQLRLSDLQYLPRALWKHPVIFVGVVLALWMVFSSLVSGDPIVALTGTLTDGLDSAILYIGLLGLMIFSYLYYQRNLQELSILSDFVVASGIIIASLALFEVFTRHSIMFSTEVQVSDLPMVTFAGHGHLAGYLVLVFGGVITMWFKRNWNVLPVMILLVFAMSVSFNRASIIAAFLVTLLGWRTPKLLLVAGTVLIGGYFCGQQIIKYQETGLVRGFTDQGTAETRKYLWKAGIAGISSRPITGYGGPLFAREWHEKLTLAELKTYLKMEMGWNVLQVFHKPNENPFFLTKDRNGKNMVGSIGAIKIHNETLDFTIMWGIIGTILYLLVLFYGIRKLFTLNFFSVSVLSIFLFSLTWFISIQTEAALLMLAALGQLNTSKTNIDSV